MNNHQSLKQKIIKDLQKTGYPTEIVSASIMEQHKWGIIHNPSYLDDIEGGSREFDIRAYHRWTFGISKTDFTLGVYLITECKKSDKPWVFFTTTETFNFSRLGRLIKGAVAEKQIFTDWSHADSVISDDILRNFHHYFSQSELARTFYEPFKGKEKADQSQMIYSAVMKSIKATLFYYNELTIKNWLRICYPVIIFSGELFKANVDSTKNIDLKSAKHIQLSFHYIEPNSPRHRTVRENHHQFIVDVIHEDYLSQFLKIIEDEHDIMVKHLQKGLSN